MKCIVCGKEKGITRIADLNYDPICFKCRQKLNYSYDVNNTSNITTFDVYLKLNKSIEKDSVDKLFQYYNPIGLMMFFEEKEIDYNILIDYDNDIIFDDEHTLIYRYNYE